MIPNSGLTNFTDTVFTKTPSYTYRIDFENKRIVKHIDGIKAMKQAVYKAINTERYNHEIYNWNYGVELSDLFGHSKTYVYPEMKRRITEALLADKRIQSVENFRLESSNRDIVVISFTVNTIFGSFEAGRKFDI